MTEDKKERRIHKRYTIKGCSIQYKSGNFLNLFSKTSNKYLVLDISQNGLQFITKEHFKKQAHLSLDITAPLLNDKVIHAKGRIAWVRPSIGLDICGIGIEFINMEEEERSKLQLLLDDAATDKDKIPDKVHLDKAEKIN